MACAAPTRLRSVDLPPTLPRRHCHDALRTFAIYGHASHCRFRSDDLGTNKPSTGDLAVEECSFDTRDAGAFSANATSLELSFNSLAGCCGLMGNNALDHPRSRSSDAETAPRNGSSKRGVPSDAMSRNSIPVSFGMSKSGASPLATDVATASANLTSGCSHEPR
jgi:hypothetical protein